MFEFQQVSKKDFNAIFRRSLVFRIKARFEDPRAIEGLQRAKPRSVQDFGHTHFPGWEILSCDKIFHGVFTEMGICQERTLTCGATVSFPRIDSDLKEFLCSGPAILAALQVQNSFEMKYSKGDCEQMIEDYAYWGGDRGLTEQTMREACGMPPRDVRNLSSRFASAIVVDNEPAEVDETGAVWHKVSEALMHHLLMLKRLDITEAMLKKLKLKDVPNMNREELFQSMKTNRIVIHSHSRGKTEAVFALGITTTATLQSIIGHMDRSSCPVSLNEKLATTALAAYFESPGRASNAEALSTVFKNLSKKLGSAGRPTAQAKAKKEKFLEQASKIQAHENACLSILKELTGPHIVSSQQSPARKRLRCKVPEIKQEREVKEEVVEDAANKFTMREYRYEYPDTTVLRTRKMVAGLGAQKFTRRAQQHLLHHTHDLDIHNSVFTVLTQLLDKLKPVPPLPEDLRATLDRCASCRDQVCVEELKGNCEEGKKILTAVLYGGAIPAHLESNQFLVQLSKASLYARWVAMSLLEEEFQRIRSPTVSKKNPDMSILSHLYLAAEDYILTSWVAFLQKFNPEHLSLRFDGVRVSGITAFRSIEELCHACQSHIADTTGFHVVVREKVPSNGYSRRLSKSRT